MKTISYEYDGPFLVLVIGRDTPDDVEWAGFLRAVRSFAIEGAPAGRYRVLVWSGGGAPSSKQRTDLTDVIKPYQAQTLVAVVTGSPLARGAVTALGWFMPVFRAFGPVELPAALDWLEVRGADAVRVRALLERLRAAQTSTRATDPG